MHYLLSETLLPPMGIALPLMLLRARWPAALAIAALIAPAMPPVATALLQSLTPAATAPGEEPKAIVILSADSTSTAGRPDISRDC